MLSFPNNQPHPSVEQFKSKSTFNGFDLDEATLRFAGLGVLDKVTSRSTQLDSFRHKSMDSFARTTLYSDDPSDLDLQRSLNSAKDAVSSHPTSLPSRLTLAFAQIRNGLFDEAGTSLEHSLQADPDNLQTQLLCKIVEQEGGNAGDLREALDVSVEQLVKKVEVLDRSKQTITNNSYDIDVLFHELMNRVLPKRKKVTQPIIVTTLLDEMNGIDTGKTSLREAVIQAASGGKIQIAVEGTIELKLGEIRIDKPLIIEGPGSDKLTISGNNNSRIFYINDNDSESWSNVHVSGVQFINGRAPQSGGYSDWSNRGGAIFSRESLTLSNCVMKNNHAQRGGAVWVDHASTTKVVSCTIAGNTCSNAGGAVCICGSRWGQRATLIVDRSTFANNKVDLVGGAIFSYGNLKMFNSTVHANVANSANEGTDWLGGGIACGAVSGKATIEHCTITDNLGGGVGFYRYAHEELRRTSVVSPIRATVRNSIIYGNTRQGKPADIGSVRKDMGDAASVYYSLIGSGTRFENRTGNLVGVDPQLIELADNGGPTQTRALSPTSPAIDSAGETNLNFDQRGTPSEKASEKATPTGIPDMGAFEFDKENLNSN